jgi:spermidine/putrescine-binding protein
MTTYSKQSPASSLVRFRVGLETPSRRSFMKSATAAGLAAYALRAPGAQAATSIKYLGWQGYDAALPADHLKQADAALETTYISDSAEIITKIRLGDGQFDICTPYFIYVDFMAREGLLEPIDLAKVPNFQKIFPYIAGLPGLSVDGKQYAVPLTWGSIPLMYNVKEVKTAPTSWMDLFKPEFKGKAAIINDVNATMVTWVRVVTGRKSGTQATREELAKVVELLIKLKKENLRTIASSYGELVDLFGRGEIVIGQGWEPVAAWVGDKAELKWVHPKEGALAFIDCYGLAKGAPELERDHALLNEALSVEGQVALATANTMPVVNSEAVAKLDDYNRGYYPYDNIQKFFTEQATIDPMYYLEDDGKHATWDEYHEAWERILKA